MLNLKKIISFQVALILLITVMGCSSKSETSTSESSNPDNTVKKLVKINYPTYQVGKAIGADFTKEAVTAFNEKFKGQYEVVIEEVPGEQPYVDKLKVLNATDDLPGIFELGRDPSLADIIIKSDKEVDLKPYIDASPEWKNMVLESSLNYNTVGGKIVGAPLTNDGYVGIFYNKEMFEKAGIKEFPKTWDDFWVTCDKLKAAGITPISLHTAETGWSTNLMLTSMIAGGSKEGLTWLNTKFPTNYDKPFFVDAAKNVQKLFTYSTKDAIGGTYAMAANNFVSGKTAMMPNGPWMIDTFKDPKSAPAGFIDKVGVASYPGDVVISNEGREYGLAIGKKQPKEVQDGAAEFLKFLATPEWVKKATIAFGRVSKNVQLTDDEKKNLDKLKVDTIDVVKQSKVVAPIFQQFWDTTVQNDAIPKDLPLLALGKMTPEAYAKEMTAAATKFADMKK